MYLIYLLLAATSLMIVVHKQFTIPLYGKNSHPFGFVIAYQVLMLTLPGALIITFGSNCLGSITCDLITPSIKEKVLLDYCIIIFTCIVAYIISSVSLSKKSDFKPASCTQPAYLWVCIFFTLGILLFRIFTVRDVPLFMAISGNALQAELAKAEILRGESGASIPIINFFLKYFPVYTFYLFAIGLINRKISKRNFFLALIVIVPTLTYDLQKTHLITAFAGAFWLYNSITGRYKSFAIGLIIVVIAICGLFYISYDFDGDNSYLIDAVLNRLLVAQAEGAFWVYQYLTPSDRYLYWGLPFASVLGISQNDPLAEIIKIVFPAAPDGWVNSTTFITGEAYAILGNFGVVFSALAVSINIFLLCLFSHKLVRKNKDVFFPAVFLMTYTFPLANNFTDLAYGRFLLGFLIFMTFPYIAFFTSIQLSKLQQILKGESRVSRARMMSTSGI